MDSFLLFILLFSNLVVIFACNAVNSNTINHANLENYSSISNEESRNKVIDFDSDDTKVNDIMLGKDREIFYISLDLKWIVCKLLDKSFWKDASLFTFKSIAWVFSKLRGNDDEKVLKTRSLNILAKIRQLNKACSLKTFLGTMRDAETYARYRGKLLILYIEESSTCENSIRATQNYRIALSDYILGSYINNHFVLVTLSAEDRSTKKLMKTLKLERSFPVCCIASPIYLTNGNYDKLVKRDKKTIFLEVHAVYGTLSSELKATKILRFLQK